MCSLSALLGAGRFLGKFQKTWYIYDCVYICVSGYQCMSVSGKMRGAKEGRSPQCRGFHRTEAQSVLARWLMDGWPPKLISLTNVVYT